MSLLMALDGCPPPVCSFQQGSWHCGCPRELSVLQNSVAPSLENLVEESRCPFALLPPS